MPTDLQGTVLRAAPGAQAQAWTALRANRAAAHSETTHPPQSWRVVSPVSWAASCHGKLLGLLCGSQYSRPARQKGAHP